MLKDENNDIEIRKLPQRVILDLSRILEVGEGWKELMSIVPNETDPKLLKYNNEQIRLIEDAGNKQQRLCSEIFFEEWGTSGRIRPRVTTLYDFLNKAELLRAAQYVSDNLIAGKISSDSNEKTLIAPCANLPTAPPLPSDFFTDDSVVNNCQGTTKCCQEDIGDVGVKMYDYEEFYKGTNGFSESLKLGEGGFGSVYLCTLSPNYKVAVKKLNNASEIPGLSGLQFRNELLTVTQFSHKNLLQLIGCSSNGPDLCLAYVFMSNGSLEENLKWKDNLENKLDWKRRFDIACGTAEGIVHLHTHIKDKPLVHRDIKSANILLDENFTPKVGDFGLARFGASGINGKTTAKTSTVIGTNAYMAVEAFRGDISVKMDTFSFGVVLLELITGLPPVDEERGDDGQDLATYVDCCDDFESLIDTRPGEKNSAIVPPLYGIAQDCLSNEKKKRPKMVEILEKLKLVNFTFVP